MSVELGRRLLLSGAVGPSEIQAALYHHLGTGTPFIRALVEVGGISVRALDEELERSAAPSLAAVIPLPAVIDELPEHLCHTLLAVPVRRDVRTGAVDVAVADPYDDTIADEFSFHLKTDVKLVRGSVVAIEDALKRLHQSERASKAAARESEPPPAPNVRSPSGPPIPLVRRASRAAEGFVGGRSASPPTENDTIEVLGVRDIVEQVEVDGGVTDELGQPILPLTTSKVPRAPNVPSFGQGHGSPSDDLGSPATSRGPFSPKAPLAPFEDIDHVLVALEKARTRDEVIDQLIVGMSTVARRVGAFAVKKRGFRGIACNLHLGEPKAFREIEIPVDAPTVLGIATSKGTYLGPLPETPPHAPLVRFLRASGGEVAAVLVSVAGRPAVVLFADTLGDSLIATRRAEQLGREASRAFSRILTEAKNGRRSDD